MTAIRHPVQIVRIIRPSCSRTFGVAPCLGTGRACYNGDGTCRYRPALDLTEEVVTDFVEDQGWPWYYEAGAYQPCLAIPALLAVDYAPTILNVASGIEDIAPLGARGVCTVRIRDFPSNDVGDDPYPETRTLDPMNHGTYWGKWLARNPRHIGWVLQVFEGEAGQALEDMILREFDLERVALAAGQAQITAKDILRRITDSGVMAPEQSPGVLAAVMSAGASSFTVAGAEAADYPTPGRVRIGEEVVGYTSVTPSGTNLVFGGLTRADLRTTATEHAQYDQVQWVLSYVDQPYTDIAYDLTVTRGGVPASYVDAAAWTAEFDDWRPLYRFTRHITVPTKIDALLGQLCLESQSYIWWDERVRKVNLKAQRPDFAPATMTDDANIIAGSFGLEEQPLRRVSEVIVYYALRSATADPTNNISWSEVQWAVNALAAEKYAGQRQIREIRAYWIDTSALALTLASSVLRRDEEVRRVITFGVTPQDIESLWTGSTCNVRHYQMTEDDGRDLVTNWLITSAETVEVGGRYRFTAEDNGAGGVLWLWQDEGEVPPDWSSATEEQRAEIPYWLDDNGLDAGGTPRPWRWL